ncbi:Serine/threonine-protein kinase pim-2 [Durusdinium trenchii]|uniref:Serine/threonine-protein kinase pim-2 n=1 Tax=Durusdinium trenchii TaxID=1381693 RepID=A0ABP0H5Z8_9DINO
MGRGWLATTLGILGSASASQVFCQEQPDNTTCILKDNAEAALGSGSSILMLTWDGNLIVPAGQKQFFSKAFVLNITGQVTFQEKSNLIIDGWARIWAKGLSMSSAYLSAKYHLVVKHSSCGEGFRIDSSQLQARQITLSCPNGDMTLTGPTSLQSSKGVLLAKNLYLQDHVTQLKMDQLNLVSRGTLHLAASPLRKSSVLVKGSDVSLGWQGGNWLLSRLVAQGREVLIANDHRIEVLGANTCKNIELPFVDLCASFAEGIDMVKSNPLSEKLGTLSVDLAILAWQELNVGPRARLLAAAPFLCSREVMVLERMAVISSDGRGCPPGEGIPGRGESRSYYIRCGAAGASNFGLGGLGAKLDEKLELTGCARPGIRSDFAWSRLPLRGAAGGGCGVPAKYCVPDPDLTEPNSAGGGLIWLSAPVISLSDGVRITASGTDGAFQNYRQFWLLVSGGGAGGQILVMTSHFQVLCDKEASSECEAPKLSATGGSAQCSSKTAATGGAGGGGFIGLLRNSTIIEDIALDVSGGGLTAGCADVLPQQGREIIQGGAGFATSLVPCQEGYSGPFCSPCPVGRWGDGQKPCEPCKNKRGFAFYAADAWPNSSCPYECEIGLPDVKINPECLNNIDFAMSCFGGRRGFLAVLICPLIIFIMARGVWWLCRQRRKSPGAFRVGSREFQPEQLPKHVCRIYWQGQNSPELPWKISRAATLIAALPSGVAEEAKKEGWEELVIQLQQAVRIPTWETYCLNLVWFLSLPLYHCMAFRQRAFRARKVSAILAAAADTGHLWTARRPRPSGSRLARAHLSFGCDVKATSAHLDVFDLSRSLVDWAPSRSEQVFVAQGKGTWEMPFELNVSDPLFLGLAQTPQPVEAQAIYSLVCTFNLFSRLVPYSELAESEDQIDLPALSLLDQEVRRCGVRLGQPLAHVQVLRFWPDEAVSAESSPREASSTVDDGAFFSELVQRIPAAETLEAKTKVEVDWKLCLVLHGNIENGELVRDVEGVLAAPGTGCKPNRKLKEAVTVTSLRRISAFLPSRRFEQLCFQALSPWVCSITNPILEFLVSVLFFTLIILDAMVCALVAYSLRNLSGCATFWIWLLLPTPLAPPLSIAAGIASLLLHKPSRLHSQLALRSSFNVLFVALPALLEADVEAPLLPCLSFLLNLAASYAAAVYAGLADSAIDLATAEDSGNASLRGQVPPMIERSREPEKSEIALTVLNPPDLPSRSRLSTTESVAETHHSSMPF